MADVGLSGMSPAEEFAPPMARLAMASVTQRRVTFALLGAASLNSTSNSLREIGVEWAQVECDLIETVELWFTEATEEEPF